MEKLLTRHTAELPAANFDIDTTVRRLGELTTHLHGASEIEVDRVKFPSGGSSTFEVPNGTPDEPEICREIEGVIIRYSFVNAYWSKPFGVGDDEPDCMSNDGISGFDRDMNETGCRNCSRNRYGSNGRGKACSNMVQLYILREGDALPLKMMIPPMSVKNFGAYLTHQVIPRDMRIWNIVTRISLSKNTNKGGIAYSQAQFQAVGHIEDARMERLRRDIAPLLGFTEEDVIASGNPAMPEDGE